MFRHIAIASAAIVTAVVPALAADRTERVQFATGTSSKTVRGTIRGYDSVNYLVRARAGQTLTISFQPNNASAYFNVWAPGADEALFVGSTSGNRYAGTLPSNGDYRVQVYLMRNAARRNESASYALTIGVR